MKILSHTHPPLDGSVDGWEGLRAYTCCVGIPMAIGAELIANGRMPTPGVVMAEFAFTPADVFTELARRDLRIQESVNSLQDGS